MIMKGTRVILSGVEICVDFSYVRAIVTDLGIRKNASGAAMQIHTNSIISILQNLEIKINFLHI